MTPRIDLFAAAIRGTCGLPEIAAALHLNARTLYRDHRWRRMIEQDGMPAPISAIGRPRFDALAINAWLGRHHPHAPKIPVANDTAPVRDPRDAAARRQVFRQIYGGNPA